MIEDTHDKYVFISYDSDEYVLADKFRKALEERGVKVLPAARASFAVDPVYIVNYGTVRDSAAVLVLFSEDTQYNEKVLDELSSAKAFNIPMFPVRVAACELKLRFKYFFRNIEIFEYHADPENVFNSVVDRLVEEMFEEPRIRIDNSERERRIDERVSEMRVGENDKDDDSAPSVTIEPAQYSMPQIENAQKGTFVLPEKYLPADVAFPSVTTDRPRLSVIGVGGAATSSLSELYGKANGLEIIAVDTDCIHLRSVAADKKVQIGRVACRGFGGQKDPGKGLLAAQESHDELEAAIEDADIVVVVAYLGGGTGTGAAPEIARIAAEKGRFVIALASMPVAMFGSKCTELARLGLEELKKHVDSYESLHINQMKFDTPQFENVLECARLTLIRTVKMLYALSRYDDKLHDVMRVLCGGEMLIGAGKASGENKDISALRAAVAGFCWRDNTSLEDAGNAVVHVSGGGITPQEIDNVFGLIKDVCDRGANVTLITDIDDNVADEFRVIVVFSGLDWS